MSDFGDMTGEPWYSKLMFFTFIIILFPYGLVMDLFDRKIK